MAAIITSIIHWQNKVSKVAKTLVNKLDNATSYVIFREWNTVAFVVYTPK